MISTVIRELIAGRRFQRGLVVDIVPHLPSEDEELDRWIERAAQENDQTGFFYVVLAALVGERKVDARHLAKGLRLLAHYNWIGIIATRLEGNVAEHLVKGVQETNLLPLVGANALFVAAIWHGKHVGGAQPPSLVAEARRVVRAVKPGEPQDNDTRTAICALAAVINDEGLDAVVQKHLNVRMSMSDLREKGVILAEKTLESWDRPTRDHIPVEPRPQTIEGFTMRRAVARISRNDPCPCGSGKKYKRCCHDKDQERLRHSSDVSGKTGEEISANLEEHLNLSRLAKMPSHDLARLDVSKIDPGIHPEYFHMLGLHSLFEKAAEAFEKLGYDAELEKRWRNIIYQASQKGNRAMIRRLANWHPDTAKGLDDHLHSSTALILLEDEPAKMLQLATDMALQTLDDEEADNAVGFAWSLLVSQFKVIGIFVARSMIPLLPRKDAVRMLEFIFEARDTLNLPPDDPYSDVLDKRFAEEPVDEGKDAGALREAQRKLETKAAEVRRIKEDLEKLRREVERREKPAKATVSAVGANAVPPVEEERLRELRGKVSELKSILNERHEERVTLRRELQQAHTDLDTLRQKQTAAVPISSQGVDREEALLLPGDVSGNQPVRVLEFPRKFHETLSSLPKPVARGAMTMLGRLAAGEPAAYVGVVRLKDCPETLRQRIGIDHRLLFRLHADRVEVVDLINRRDLERRIKTLV